VRVAVHLPLVRSARDDELRVRHVRERLDEGVHAFALDEPADGDDPSQGPAHGEHARRGAGAERLEVDAAGGDVDLLRARAELEQLTDLVGARGDDGVGVPREVLLAGQAVRRAGVCGALVPALDHAESVEGLDDRDAGAGPRPQRRRAGHPEVGVYDVGPVPGLAGAAPAPGQPGPELRHERRQRVLANGAGGPGRHVDDLDAGMELHDVGQAGRVAPGEDLDAVPAVREGRGEGGDVDVLAAGVLAAEDGERAGVLGDHGDPHRATSSRSRSQSARKRASP
jgi:hypothetical protein